MAVLKYDGERAAQTLPAQAGDVCSTATTSEDIFATLSDEIVVNENNALTISAVYACIKVISEGLAIAPIQLIRKKDNKRTKVTNHPLHRLLSKKPNNYMTPSDLKKIYALHMGLTGAFYAQKIKNRAGDITQLVPLNPTTMFRDFRSGELRFIYYANGTRYDLTQDDVFHVTLQTLDGVNPVSPITAQKHALGLAKATETHGMRYFKNDATPPYAISVPDELSDDAFKRAKQSIQENLSGANKHKPFLLEGGATLLKLGLSPEDSQFLETRKYQKTDVCAMYKVPPHLIADLEKSSFNNIEQQDLNFTKFTLMPYMIAFEEAANVQLLSEKEQEDHYFKFNANALLRGEYESRMNGYRVGREIGIFSVNDIREFEDMDPVENGDGRLQPLNFTELGAKQEKGGESA